MYPYVYVFGRPLPMYGLCALVGLLVSAGLIVLTLRKRRDYSKIHIVNIPLFAAIGAFVGAHILYAITRMEVLVQALQKNAFSFDTIKEMFGGMVFYGGLIGAIFAAFLYCKIARADFSLFADIFAPAIPLFHTFGRIGCVFAGCCYGIEASWGLTYTEVHHGVMHAVTRLPLPLIEAGCNLIIMAALLILSHKRLKKGSLMAIYFMAYAVVRFIDEFFRGDEIRGKLFGLSTSQWISILVFAAGVFMILNRYVLKSKDKFGYHVRRGEVPEGYIYNKYAGAVAPWEQHKLKNYPQQNEETSDAPEGSTESPDASESSPDTPFDAAAPEPSVIDAASDDKKDAEEE